MFLLLIVVTYKRELGAKTGDNGQQIFYMEIARKAFVRKEKDSKGQQKKRPGNKVTFSNLVGVRGFEPPTPTSRT